MSLHAYAGVSHPVSPSSQLLQPPFTHFKVPTQDQLPRKFEDKPYPGQHSFRKQVSNAPSKHLVHDQPLHFPILSVLASSLSFLSAIGSSLQNLEWLLSGYLLSGGTACCLQTHCPDLSCLSPQSCWPCEHAAPTLALEGEKKVLTPYDFCWSPAVWLSPHPGLQQVIFLPYCLDVVC